MLFPIATLGAATSATGAKSRLSAYGRWRFNFRHWTVVDADIRPLLGLSADATSSDVKAALKRAIEAFPRTDEYRLQWSPRGDREIEDWESAWVHGGVDVKYTAYTWMNR